MVSQTEVNKYQTFSEVLGLSEFTTAKQTGPSFRGELLETIQNTYMSICHNHKNVSYTLHMAGTHDNTHTPAQSALSPSSDQPGAMGLR